jgi:hypothetical protein
LIVLPLRYPWFWRIVGWALVAVVCIGSVLPERALEVLGALAIPDKVEHATSYLVLMVWFAGLHARRDSVPIAIGLVALGLGLEIVQGRLGYRTFDWLDLAADTVGVVAGWVLSMTWLEGWCQRVERRLFASSG